jgi:hypothetical protein
MTKRDKSGGGWINVLADDIKRETGVSLTIVAANITSEEGRRAVLGVRAGLTG